MPSKLWSALFILLFSAHALAEENWCITRKNEPIVYFLKSQPVYLLNSYLARMNPAGFSVWNVTLGAISNIDLACASYSEDPQNQKIIGIVGISIFNLAAHFSDMDGRSIFISNYISWNVLHWITEKNVLFTSTRQRFGRSSLQLGFNHDGTLLEFRNNF